MWLMSDPDFGSIVVWNVDEHVGVGVDECMGVGERMQRGAYHV
jgi:hypothetical protein